MSNAFIAATLAILAAVSTPALSATQTVTLSVSELNDCPTCPIMVRQALTRVGGVAKVEILPDRGEAVVTFDDAKTNVAALLKATADAGHPSVVKK